VSEALQQEIRHLRTLQGSARDPHDRIFLPLADAHLRLGQVDTAVDMLREGLTRVPDFVAAHVLMGRALAARGDLDGAEETWAAARRLDPRNAEALLALGHVLVGRGESVGGELVLRARALDPSAGGQEPDADLVSIADLAPVSVSAQEAVLAAGLAAGDAEVLSISDLAPDGAPQAELPDERPADPLGVGSDVHAGEAAETSPANEEPDRVVGQRHVVTRTLAELLAAQGQVPRAVEMYEELLARSPHDPVLRDRLRELRDVSESGGSGPPEAVDPQHDDDEVDHRLSRPAPDPDTPTPFAWTEGAHGSADRSAMRTRVDAAAGASQPGGADASKEPEPRISDYLGGLLAASPSSSSGDVTGS
jgi:Flp pilus assembly protein TadD